MIVAIIYVLAIPCMVTNITCLTIGNIYEKLISVKSEKYLQQYENTTFHQCFHKCARRTICTTFNHNFALQICQLCDLKFEGNKIESFGWTFYRPRTKPAKIMETNTRSTDQLSYDVNVNVNEVSFCTWIKETKSTYRATLFSLSNKENCDILTVRYNCRSKIINDIAVNNKSHHFTINRHFTDASFHHLCFVYRGPIVTVYIDSALVKAIKVKALENITVSANIIVIGNRLKATCHKDKRSFLGYIYDFNIFDRTLTLNEIDLIKRGYRIARPLVSWAELTKNFHLQNSTGKIQLKWQDQTKLKLRT